MADDRWCRSFDAVVASAVPTGSRILDLGCGDGGLVERLAELGYDALGVDPGAPTHEHLIRQRIEDVEGLGKFDAVIAVMALHHADLGAVFRAVAGLLHPHGQLLVSDFAWDAYDERAAAWIAEHDRSDADNSVVGWRREHQGLHTGSTITAALSASLVLTREVRGPYLARMLARHDLETEERERVDAGLVPALGLQLTGRLA
jgi:2-polyprenyl-3-methyl-5-hydroxy-6-metoxy-1,4-benzoquinol methylase